MLQAEKANLLNIQEIQVAEKQIEKEKKRQKLQEDTGGHRRKIDVYNREKLEFIETIIGVRNCAKKYNIDCSHLSELCKNGYTKKYEREYVFCYSKDNIEKSFRQYPRFTFQRKDTTPIIQIDRYGNFIKEWRTMGDAQKELSLHEGSVSRVISGKIKHTKNYYFLSKNKYNECTM